jgi:hypothetical protein
MERELSENGNDKSQTETRETEAASQRFSDEVGKRNGKLSQIENQLKVPEEGRLRRASEVEHLKV